MKFITDDMHGNQFYMYKNDDGIAVLCNEEGVDYSDHIQELFVILNTFEFGSIMKELVRKEVSDEETIEQMYEEVQKRILNRWYNLDYITDEEIENYLESGTFQKGNIQ